MRSWSQRRAAVAAEAHADLVAEEAAREDAFEAEQAERSDADILEELGLPDPDTLGEGADFKGFLAKGVPERIKTRALRRLWRLNPVLANVDGLVDYGEDYTDAAMIIEGMQTAYQVGKGMLKHVEALAEEAEAEARDAAGEDVPGEPAEAPENIIETPEVTPLPTPVDAVAALPTRNEGPDEQAPVALVRRRMTITFEETA